MFFYVFYQVVVCIIINPNEALGTYTGVQLILAPILGSILNLEGGIIFVGLGIMMYYCLNNKRQFMITYILYCLMVFFLSASGIITRGLYRIEFWGFHRIYDFFKFILDYIVVLDFSIPQISFQYMFYSDYQWMMLLALPFLILYNGQKGKGYKYFFYFFYPIHLIILYLVGRAFNGIL